jgi:hypothetical protein
MKDFAKIIRARDGRQVLYYVEPEGGDYTLHQVIPFDGFQVDMKMQFESPDADKNEESAFKAFDLMEQQQADNGIAIVLDMLDGTIVPVIGEVEE